MNEIVFTFFLIADKFMPKMHLRSPGSTYSAYFPFTKKRTKKIKEARDIFIKMDQKALVFNMTWLMDYGFKQKKIC